MNPASRVAIIVLVVVAAGGGFLWWRHRPTPPPALPSPPVSRPIAPVAVPVPVPARPSILYPLKPATGAPRAGLPALDESDAYFRNALVDLLGRKSVLSFLVVDGFARRFVATVNNLATDNAAADMWPVNRTAGRFTADARNGGTVIGAGNADRYAGFLRFVEGVDTQRAVALYTRLYPLLQSAYEDLGFPGKYFNDRVVEVIDDLLATPDLPEPARVKRVEVAGSPRPPETAGSAGLFVFEDPTLEARSTGQKILLRIGRENAANLKAKLRDARGQIAGGAVARTPGNR